MTQYTLPWPRTSFAGLGTASRFSLLVAVMGAAVLAPNCAPSAHAAAEPAPAEKLKNGITLVARTDRTAPEVVFSLLLQCGAADENEGNAGWRRLAVNAMLHGLPTGYANPGTGDDDEALSRAAAAAGGTIGATVGSDSVEIYVEGGSEHNADLLKLALAVLQHPRLSDADIDEARQKLLDDVSESVNDPAAKTEAALRGQLYRDASGTLVAYGLPDEGTADSLKSLTDAQVRDLYTTRLAPARLVVAAAGDVDIAAVHQILGDQAATTQFIPPPPYFAPANGKQPALVVREFPTPVAWVFVSYALPAAAPADAPALRVLTAALADSSKARLPERLLAHGLVNDPNAAISIAAQFTPRRYADEISMYAQTSPQGVDHIKNGFLDEIRKLRDAPLTPGELVSAKIFLRGTWAVEREALRDRAFQAALAPIVGDYDDTSWPDMVDHVTAADVQRVARKYLNNYGVALVMPQG